ncbi:MULTISPECIES: TRAP transporter substrate-binding protein DctP [unclassified Treponema]|uniref:TRAP transporter substrate-binding protein DctP n=1 Tax=unclassified Treponema TaxID=2638727 RepID=UPI0020A234A9|nr:MULTISPECIES: TRAP transporter substrate-binding protein DctP [unclassified Treponema]UTC67495.1 TRAP transporter substrate-binding protein DctP [Treponema sp. OMZ 789]UTC70223.1 TRAP transporter substrate-binding protein DctP [Treponema sp. OMZ 790]UTC72938.1 TRAP transporter substrate-binding protein DctP [Treponema sp. OMZ 791]
MKKKLLFIFFAFIAVSGIFAQKKVVLKIASSAPARTPWDIELKKLAQEWNKITNGLVSVRFMDMTVLGGEKAGVVKMKPSRPGQRPQIDGAILTPVGLNELAPNAKIFTLSLPFLIQSQDELDLILNKYGYVFENEIQKNGCKLITWSNVGWLSFYTKDSYSSLNELKKIKMICSNDTKDFIDVLNISGFNVLPVNPAKFTQEMKATGGARSFASVSILTYTLRLNKDVSYMLDARLCPIMAGFVIADESWALIPEQYKPAMLAAMDRTTKNLNAALEDMEKDYAKKMKQEGLKVISLTSQQKKEWAQEFHMDMKKVQKAIPSVINAEIYEKIVKQLEAYRK